MSIMVEQNRNALGDQFYAHDVVASSFVIGTLKVSIMLEVRSPPQLGPRHLLSFRIMWRGDHSMQLSAAQSRGG